MTDDRILVAYRRHSRNVTPHVLRLGLLVWTPLLGVAAHRGLRRDEIAEHRAALMWRLTRTAGHRDRHAAAGRAARHWAGIARYERSRLALYGTEGSCGVPCGAAGSSAMALTGHTAVGFGRRFRAQDVLVGVVRLRRGRWARGEPVDRCLENACADHSSRSTGPSSGSGRRMG